MSNYGQVFTVIGYAVGSYFLGPYGGAIGGAIGGAVGGAIDANQAIKLPGLSDTTVAPSQYGIGVPKTYGSDRVACAPIWSLPKLIESEHTSRSGGSAGQKVTTKSYSLSWAVLIGEGPIVGIRRMWIYGKLVYDARSSADAATAAESAKFREYFTLYLGTEDQMPDPTIEAEVGAGKVPALRGTAYIVFNELPLEKWGNRMPEVSVEVATGGPGESSIDAGSDGTGVLTVREPLWIYRWDTTQELEADPWRTAMFGEQPTHSLGTSIYTWGSEPTDPETSTSFSVISQAQALNYGSDNYNPGAGRNSYIFAGPGWWFNSVNPTLNIAGGASLDDDAEELTLLACSREAPGSAPMYPDLYALNVPLRAHRPVDLSQIGGDWAERYALMWRQLTSPGDFTVPFGYGFLPYAGLEDPVNSPLWSYAHVTYMLRIRARRVPHHPQRSGRPGNPGSAPEGLAELQGTPGYVIDQVGNVTPNRNWTIATGTAKQLCAIEYRNGRLYQNARGPVLLPDHPDYDNAAFWDALAAEYTAIPDPFGELARRPDTVSKAMRPDVAYPVVVTSWAVSDSSDGTKWIIPGADSDDDDEAGNAVLGDIVRDICEEAGLQPGQLDVTELTDRVIGYTRVHRMTARAALEPLRAAFLFDLVQSGDKIVARKRGRSVTTVIGADDLGAGKGAAQKERVESARGQESELPDVVSIIYKDLDLDYLPGTQESRRRAGESDQQMTLELSVVMRADKARQLADAHLFTPWLSRTKRTIWTTLAHAEVEPGDVIEFTDA